MAESQRSAQLCDVQTDAHLMPRIKRNLQMNAPHFIAMRLSQELLCGPIQAHVQTISGASSFGSPLVKQMLLKSQFLLQ